MVRSLFLVFAASVGAAQAQAATVTQAVSFGPALTDFTSATLTVAPFDTTLGTLKSVNLNLAATATVSGTVTNNSPTAQSFQVSTNTAVTLASNSGTSIAGLSVTLVASQNLSNVASGATVLFGPFTPGASKNIAGTPLSAFIAGPIALTATTVSNAVIQGSGNNLFTTVSSSAAGTLTVTYTYDALIPGENPGTVVPEPASLALLGIGLLGAGVLRRVRN